MIAETKVGLQMLANGSGPNPVRSVRSGAIAASDAHARFQEAVLQGNVYSLTLNATTTGVAAGNIVAAAALASTQFALFNPVGSNKNLVLWRFGMGIISGTAGAGPLWHGMIAGVTTSVAAGTIRNMFGANTGSVAVPLASAAGTSLIGTPAPFQLTMANFSSTNTAQASVFEVATTDFLDGQIIIPQGMGWLPLWSAGGTSVLNGYSITWEEIPA